MGPALAPPHILKGHPFSQMLCNYLFLILAALILSERFSDLVLYREACSSHHQIVIWIASDSVFDKLNQSTSSETAMLSCPYPWYFHAFFVSCLLVSLLPLLLQIHALSYLYKINAVKCRLLPSGKGATKLRLEIEMEHLKQTRKA